MVSVASSTSSDSDSPRSGEFLFQDSEDDCYRVQRCHCHTKLKIETDWDPQNPGRRFVRCPNRQECNCGLFKWIDPIFPPQATRVILDLVQQRANLQTIRTELMVDINEKMAEIRRLRFDFEEAKGFAEFLSVMADEKERQLEVARKEIRGVLRTLDKLKMWTTVVVGILSVAIWFLKCRGSL